MGQVGKRVDARAGLACRGTTLAPDNTQEARPRIETYREGEMKIVAIKQMCEGNDSVGAMWQETKIFDGEAALVEVMAWVGSRERSVTLTVPDGETFPQTKFKI